MGLYTGGCKCNHCGTTLTDEELNIEQCITCLAPTPRSAKVVAQSHHIGEGNADLLADAVNSTEGYPNNNPKAAIGSTKCPLHLVPPALSIGVAEAMKNGADKYGAFNFRDSKIAASVYTGAILRHLYAYMDGEDNASDSGIHHLKHIGASIALMLDSMAAGTYDDDRPTKGGAAKLLEEYNAFN